MEWAVLEYQHEESNMSLVVYLPDFDVIPLGNDANIVLSRNRIIFRLDYWVHVISSWDLRGFILLIRYSNPRFLHQIYAFGMLQSPCILWSWTR